MSNTCALRSLPACFRRSKNPQKASTRFQEDPYFFSLPGKCPHAPAAVMEFIREVIDGFNTRLHHVLLHHGVSRRLCLGLPALFLLRRRKRRDNNRAYASHSDVRREPTPEGFGISAIRIIVLNRDGPPPGNLGLKCGHGYCPTNLLSRVSRGRTCCKRILSVIGN